MRALLNVYMKLKPAASIMLIYRLELLRLCHLICLEPSLALDLWPVLLRDTKSFSYSTTSSAPASENRVSALASCFPSLNVTC